MGVGVTSVIPLKACGPIDSCIDGNKSNSRKSSRSTRDFFTEALLSYEIEAKALCILRARKPSGRPLSEDDRGACLDLGELVLRWVGVGGAILASVMFMAPNGPFERLLTDLPDGSFRG